MTPAEHYKAAEERLARCEAWANDHNRLVETGVVALGVEVLIAQVHATLASALYLGSES